MTALGFTTKIVHSDHQLGLEAGAVHAPIHNSVPYGFKDVQGLIDVFQGQPGHAYARSSTPTLDALCKKIQKIDNGVATAVFSCGMAAFSTDIRMCSASINAPSMVASGNSTRNSSPP